METLSQVRECDANSLATQRLAGATLAVARSPNTAIPGGFGQD